MAIRYAVATGNWNATTTWSDTDGGAAGFSAPVAGDTAYLTATSGAITVTLSAAAACATLTCTGFTGTLAFSIYGLTVSSAFTLASGMTSTASSDGGITLSASGTATGASGFTFAPKLQLTSNGSYTINTAGGTWGSVSLSGSGTRTVTLSSTLTITTLNHTGCGLVFAGAYDITIGTYNLGSISPTAFDQIQIVSGQTLTVSSAMTWLGSALATVTIRAVTSSSSANVVFSGAAASCCVSRLTFTDIAYSGSTVTDLPNWYGGTLTRTSGITNRTSTDIGGGSGGRPELRGANL